MRLQLLRLKELRKKRNLSQKDLAAILNTSNSSICDWECGRSQPDIETLIELAKYFEVTIDYLVGLDE